MERLRDQQFDETARNERAEDLEYDEDFELYSNESFDSFESFSQEGDDGAPLRSAIELIPTTIPRSTRAIHEKEVAKDGSHSSQILHKRFSVIDMCSVDAQRHRARSKTKKLHPASFLLLEKRPSTSYEVYQLRRHASLSKTGEEESRSMHLLGGIREHATQVNECNHPKATQSEDIVTETKEMQFDRCDGTDFENLLAACRNRDYNYVRNCVGTGSSATATINSSSRVNLFLQRAGRVCEALIEESLARVSARQQSTLMSTETDEGMFTHNDWIVFGDSKGANNSATTLLLEGRRITNILCSSMKPTMIASVHTSKCIGGRKGQDALLSTKNIVCVWHTYSSATPSYVLVAEGKITSSLVWNNVIVAGTEEGSLQVWDFLDPQRNRGNIFRSGDTVELSPLKMMRPIFHSDWRECALIHHFSPIVDVREVPGQEVMGGNLCQFASIDESGVIILWSLLESSECVDQENTERIRVSQTRTMKIGENRIEMDIILSSDGNGNLIDDLSAGSIDYQVLGLRFVSSSSFVVPLSTGVVALFSLYQANTRPRIYSMKGDRVPCHRPHVTSIEFSPFWPQIFLVGWYDGYMALFHLSSCNPVMVWDAALLAGEGAAIRSQQLHSIEWSPHRPMIFFVLVGNHLVSMDLFVSDQTAAFCEQLHVSNNQEKEVASFALSSVPSTVGNPLVIAVVASGTRVMSRRLSSRLTTDEGRLGTDEEPQRLQAYVNSVVC